MIYTSPNITPRQHLRGLDSEIMELRKSLLECSLYDLQLQNHDEYSEAMSLLRKAAINVAHLRAHASPDTFDKLAEGMPCYDAIIKRL